MHSIHMRSLYRWVEGTLRHEGVISEAHLRAWEYEPVSNQSWPAEDRNTRDAVRLWRTRRPDLATPELWIGEQEEVVQKARL